MKKTKENIHRLSVDHFGKEWNKFKQDQDKKTLKNLAQNYFKIFPWGELSMKSVGFDMGCGSGRWANYVSPKVKKLFCIDPSQEAIQVAKKNLKKRTNCVISLGSTSSNELEDNSMDFGYSLGVLHHIPDTQLALKDCSRKSKKGSPFLLYLYYKFDNRNFFFKLMWFFSNILRLVICRLPFSLKRLLTDLLALLVYLPLARMAFLFNKLGINTSSFPLTFYKDLPFYSMRTDSLDRFGTPLEQRFTKKEIEDMMEEAGFINVTFMEEEPFWVCVGHKK